MEWFLRAWIGNGQWREYLQFYNEQYNVDAYVEFLRNQLSLPIHQIQNILRDVAVDCELHAAFHRSTGDMANCGTGLPQLIKDVGDE